MTQRKAFTADVQIKDADDGTVEAVFATFGVMDLDFDLTLPGAFEDGAPVVIGGYGHGPARGELPVGKGVIKTTRKDARLVGRFFLNTDAGREHFAVIKELGSRQQWSYAYDVQKTGQVTEELRQRGVRRVLAKLFVHEVSPVLCGAGIDTRTVSAKGMSDRQLLELEMAIAQHYCREFELDEMERRAKRRGPRSEDEIRSEDLKIMRGIGDMLVLDALRRER